MRYNAFQKELNGLLALNPGLRLYLTDFLNRTFSREIAQNRDFYGGEKLSAACLYHAGINHDAPGLLFKASASFRKASRNVLPEGRRPIRHLL
jgi:hypothetical protein